MNGKSVPMTKSRSVIVFGYIKAPWGPKIGVQQKASLIAIRVSKN